MPRKATVVRKTKETEIKVDIVLDGKGNSEVKTGLPFFDHMLDLLARHSHTDILITAKGDIEVDGHHTVEDVGICLGQAVKQALGDKRGINRFGNMKVPMGQSMAEVVMDICNRPGLLFDVKFSAAKTGEFDSELVKEFFEAFSIEAGITLHIRLAPGGNVHHDVEAIFKAFARALDQAIRIDERVRDEVPSTKGVL